MPTREEPEQAPHRRRNPLKGEWVLVSPHRSQRPWQGAREEVVGDDRPKHHPDCHLCPGNERAGGQKNPVYTETFVFQNDFPALLMEEAASPKLSESELFQRLPARGECRVICFSPRHDLSLAQMDKPGLTSVVELWCAQSEELHRRWKWVQIFENKGAMMGCSNPHPHGQIWASDSLPNEAVKEDTQQQAFFERHGVSLLAVYTKEESHRAERVVSENDHWLCVVPYWAVWPYETLLIPRRAVQRLEALTSPERDALAAILADFLPRYDALFASSFPYSMGWHGAPGPGPPNAPHWHLHAHFYPPLLRSATRRKFLVGYEMLAEAQRDLTAEQAAQQLRDAAPRREFRP